MDTRKITEIIIKNLSDRRGFDGWFDSIDYDIQEEIKEEIQTLLDAEKQKLIKELDESTNLECSESIATELCNFIKKHSNV